MNKDVAHNPNNIYVKYFITNPFDVLNEVKGEIELIKTTFATPAINELFTQEILSNLFESDGDPATLLKSAQAQLENEVR